MKNLTDREVILSIETTSGGGSLSILANALEIDSWIGRRDVSKADDILEQISKLLNVNKIEKNNVKLICVASGMEGSTGEKIGWAIGKGLAKAFDCPLKGISILESLLLEVENEPDGEYVTAFPGGKKFIYWQRFIRKNESFFPTSAIEICEADEFFMLAQSFGCKRIVIAMSPADHLGQFFKDVDKILLTESKSTLANLNGRAANLCIRVR
jgi:tRNA A37 threonylcarbamoyladenosine modification protein TsaB